MQPLGLAERGAGGHRNRVRAANLALADLVEDFADVHVVDVAHALAREGALALVDDGLFSFSHLGSPGWLLQRPESEKAAVHDLIPEADSVVALVGGDPGAARTPRRARPFRRADHGAGARRQEARRRRSRRRAVAGGARRDRRAVRVDAGNLGARLAYRRLCRPARGAEDAAAARDPARRGEPERRSRGARALALPRPLPARAAADVRTIS